MTDSVLRALRASGGRKTGTALEITSMPVIAVAPEEKARRMSRIPTPSVACRAGGATAWNPCEPDLTSPAMTISATARMNR